MITQLTILAGIITVLQAECAQPIMNLVNLDQNYQQISEEFDFHQEVSFSFWFKYEPKTKIQTQYFYGSSTESEQVASGSLLFRLYEEQAKLFRIFTYLDSNNQNLQTMIINADQNISSTETFNLNFLDGIWQYKFYKIVPVDRKIYHFIYNYMVSSYTVIESRFDIEQAKIQLSIGGQGYFSDYYQNLYFNAFPGLISSINVFQGSLDITIPQFKLNLDTCIQGVLVCTPTQQKLISGIQTSQTQILKSNFKLENTFEFQGWYKLSINNANKIYHMLQIRDENITTFNIIDPRNLLLDLRCVVLDGGLNVEIQLTLQSYEQHLYYSKDAQVKVDTTVILVSQWHFITIMYDREQTQQTGIDVYFPSANQKIEKRYLNLILFFAGSDLYFYLGSNNKLSQYFSGQIGESKINSCIKRPYAFELQCDNTCKLCDGPTQTFCTQCEATDNRELSNHQCLCQANYFQFAFQRKCRLISLGDFFSIKENKEDQIQCYYGQFFVNYNEQGRCIDCPFAQIGTTILCGDCFENQQNWQYSMKCTYKYEVNDPLTLGSTYMRVEQEPQQYIMDINSGSINICIGCSDICNEDDCQSYKYTNFGQLIKVRCKSNYYFKDGECRLCDQFCNICTNQVCTQCQSNYYFNSILQKCLLSTSATQQCGFNCLKCTYQENSNRCLICQQNYKISDDGYNCETYEITDCLNEHNKQGVRSSIPYLFDPLTQLITQPYCSFCSKNNYDTVANKCTTETLPATCSYQIDKTICLFGTDSTLIKTACTSPCTMCIKDNADFTQEFCVQCPYGQYIDLLSGTCLPCPSNCKDCAYNLLPLNNNRISISLISFYQQGLLKEYLDSLLKIPQDLFELFCKDCQDGYVTNNGACINECPSNCQECKAINNKNVCIKCIPTTQTNLDANCLECPSNCLACSERTQEEILKINPFFDLSISTFKKHSNQCYKPTKTKPVMSNQIALDCNTIENCYKSFNLQINLYCWKDEFLDNDDETEDYHIYNYYLGDFVNQFELNFLNQQFLEQLNQFQIQQISIDIKLISSTGDCSFDNNKFILNQKFVKYIFNLQRINVKFYSEDQLKLHLPDLLQLQNYSTLVFQNIIFFGNNNVQVLDATSYNSHFQIQIKDCQYTALNNEYENNAFQFKLQQVQTIIIQNFQITNVKLFNFGLFNLSIFTTDFSLEVNQLQILDSTLKNLNLFEISNPSNFDFNIKLEDIEMKAKLFNSSFLVTRNSNKMIGVLNLLQFSLSESNLFGSNYLFDLRTKISNLVDCFLESNILYNETSLMYSQGFNLQNIKITKSIIYFGTFFTNYDENYNQINEDLVLTWKQLLFEQISYSNYNQFIILKNNTNTQIDIQGFSIKGNILNKDSLKKSNYQKSLVYLEGKKLALNDLNIIKLTGIIELFLQFESIEIRKSVITQKAEAQIIIQPSLSCQNNYYDLQLYTPIIEIVNSRSVLIDSLQISSLSVVDNYMIGFEENDGNKITVTIQNSQFFDNNLLIESSSVNSGIIKFISNSESTITFQYNQASNNILYSYSSDQNSLLGTVLMISNLYGSIVINNNQFINNQAINTTYSMSYFYAQQVTVKDNSYKNNNFDDLELIYNKISDSYGEEVYIEQIKEIYKILSNGGNGFYRGDNILIQNCIFDSSTALYGGGLYIQTINKGRININNCQFLNLKTDLSANLEGKGGALVIDGSDAEIQLRLYDCIFDKVMAKLYGGAIYFDASQKLNNIEMKNLKLNNVMSLMGSFFYVQFSNQDISNLLVDNLIWKMESSVIKQYFGEFKGFKSDYQTLIKEKSMLVVTQNGNIKLQNFKIYSTYYFGLISMIECFRCTVHNILIYQAKRIYYNAFYFGNNNLYALSYIILNQIYFDTLTVYPYTSTTNCQSLLDMKVESAHVSCNQKQFLRRGIQSAISDTKFQNNGDCNLNLLLQYSFNSGGVTLMDLFHGYQLDGSKMSQTQHIKSVTVLASAYDYLDTSFEIVVNIYAKNNKTLLISDIFFIESSGYQHFKIQPSKEQQRLLQQSSSQSYEKYPIYIENFVNHLGNYWLYSGLLIFNYQAIINNFILTNTTQVQSYQMEINNGFENYIFFSNILVTDNVLQSVNLSYPLRTSVNPIIPELINSNTVILFNYRKDYSTLSNIAEFRARRLAFKYDGVRYLRAVEKLKTDTKIIEEIYIKPYKAPGITNFTKYLMLPSGQSFENYSYFDKLAETFIPLNINMSITLMNSQLEKTILFSGAQYNLTAKYRIMNESNPMENTTFTDLLTIQVTDSTKNEKFINELVIDFDPYADPSLYYQLSFTCNFIQIISYSDSFPYKMKNTITDYELRMNIRTYKCQVGEYIYLNQCRQCDDTQNYFQVLEGQSFCYFKDDVSTIQVQRFTVQMKPQYWRYVFNSTKIEYCYHLPTNCLGGWKYGDQTCIEGHIGALCEQCDLYNTRGDGSYSVSSQYNCGSCADVKWNIIIIVIIALFTLVLGIITVKSNADDTDSFNLQVKALEAFGIPTSIRIMSTILIKLLTNYAQIISSVFTFQLTLPPEIQQSTNSVGNPTQSMVYSLDCFLMTMSDMTIMYLEFIWMLATPFFFIFIIYFIYFFIVVLKMSKFNMGVISTTLIYFYIYMQPNLIQTMISQLSRRSISGVEFVQGNVAYLFQSKTHQKWLIFVIVPILLIIGFVIPLTLWYQVFKNQRRGKLKEISVRNIWGFLYNEYKINAYYWETIKLIQKQTIIIALNYYEDQVSIKASLILLIVFLYHVLSNKINPYSVVKLNRLDTYCTVVCSISIILCSTIYSAQVGGQYEIVWPFYIITAAINLLYIFELVIEIIVSYLAQYQELLDKLKTLIRNKCPYLVDNYPCFQKLLTTKSEKQRKVREIWKKVRKPLMVKVARVIKAKEYTENHSPESFYKRRGGVSSPSPIFSYRGDGIRGDMIDSQSQLNSSMQRRQNMSNPTIRLVETLYQQRNEEEKLDPRNQRDEFQVAEDPLSPRIVYLSLGPNTRSVLRE
ncbi:unnamed protein product [Paramecium octaurelia]|uniref:Uncharacterized protein n=1 Tax=Paramecium octaurelia TaxID=43137 RepID=A0A8S1XPW9_PAROT|nr:unnamed protein product [Paramecium octaurelia]